MRITVLLATTLLSLSLSLTASAQTSTNRPLSLDDCIKLALEHNLNLQIERYNPTLSQLTVNSSVGAAYDPVFSFNLRESFASSPGRIDAVTGLPNFPSENFTDTYSPGLRWLSPMGTAFNLSANLTRNSGTSFPTFQYSDNVGLSLSQPLLKNAWIDGTRTTIQLNRRNLQISEYTLRQKVLDTVTSVQLAYYDLIFSIENVKVQEAALGLAEKLLAENKKRVEVGALAPLDEKQAESQVAARKADLLAAQRSLAAQQNILKSLITEEYSQWHDVEVIPTETLVAVPAPLDLQESWNNGLSNRPDLVKQRLDLEKRNITLRYSKNQLFPSLDLTASFGHNGLGNTFDRSLNGLQQGQNQFYSYGLVLTIPLGNRDARNRYQTSKEEKAQALLTLKRLEQEAIVQIDDAVGNVRSNFEKAQATREARKYAELALDAEQKKLENGKSTSFFVLQLQRDLTSARSAEIRALADYNKSIATLSLNEGTTLEKNRIQLEVK
jgi:outer membrane protein TolC